MKQFATFEKVKKAPATGEIFNAPRPLPGHEQWLGDFQRGCFYASVNLGEYDAEELLRQIEDQDGWRVVVVTDEEFTAWVKRKVKEHNYQGEVDARLLYDLRRQYLEERYGEVWIR